jgi:hypothetical protein
MFLESSAELGLAAESCATVDAMCHAWSGAYPPNRAPTVTALTLDGKVAAASVALTAGQAVQANVTATDPEGDPMTYVWEILREPTLLGSGGTTEPRPARIGTPQRGTTPMLGTTAPPTAGEYRIFVYVLDGKGHAGTANLPFRVN